MTTIRPAGPDDMDAVAAMFQRVFRSSDADPPSALVQYLRRLLFEQPELDPEISSLVAVGESDAVLGFICVLPILLQFGAQIVRAACAGSLMVADPERNPLIGARLIRSYLNGPQELSFSESANARSRAMWEKLGGSSAPAYSMDWFRVLRPAGFAVSLGERKLSLARILRPVGALADHLVGRGWLPSHESSNGAGPVVRDVAAGEAAFLSAVQQLSQRYALRPAWSEATLGWRLSHAQSKQGLGPLSCAVATLRDEVIGCYACYMPQGGIAQVLQLLAAPGAEASVVSHLLDRAAAAGCVAVRGRCQPEQLDAVLGTGAILVSRSSTMFKTRDPELASAITGGQAWITGLACESWVRLIGDEFKTVRTS